MVNEPEITPPRYFYAVNGIPRGPVSGKQLRQLVAEGTIKPSDMIWEDGKESGIPAGKIKSLFPTVAANPPGSEATMGAPTNTQHSPNSPVPPPLPTNLPPTQPQAALMEEGGRKPIASFLSTRLLLIACGLIALVGTTISSSVYFLASSPMQAPEENAIAKVPDSNRIASLESLEEKTESQNNTSAKTHGPLPADVRIIAELISIDYTADMTLERVSASMITQKLEKRLQLVGIAQRHTDEIGQLAKRLSKSFSHLEHIYTTFVANDFGALPLALMSELFAQARADADLASYTKETQSYAPILVAWFQTHGNPTEVDGKIECQFDRDMVNLTNQTGHDLSDSMVVLSFGQLWGEPSNATMFVESWKSGSVAQIPCRHAGGGTAVSAKMTITGWTGRSREKEFVLTHRIKDVSEQLCQGAEINLQKKLLDAAKVSAEHLNAVLAKYPDARLAERVAVVLDKIDRTYEANLRNAVRTGDVFIGTWSAKANNDLNRGEVYTGKMGLYISQSHDEQGNGPIEGLLFDPTTPRLVKSVSGTYDRRGANFSIFSDPATGPILPPSRLPATINGLRQGDRRSYRFEVDDSGINGNDSLAASLHLKRDSISDTERERFRLAAAGNSLKGQNPNQKNKRAGPAADRVRGPDWPTLEWWEEKLPAQVANNAAANPFKKEFRAQTIRNHPVQSVSFLGSGERLISANDYFQIWNTRTGKSTDAPPQYDGCGLLCVSSRQDRIIVGRIGSLELFDGKGKPLVSLPLKKEDRDSSIRRTVRALEMTSDGKNLFCGVDTNELWTHDTKSWNCVDMTGAVSALKLSSGQLFVGLENGGTERLEPGHLSALSDHQFPSHQYPVADFDVVNETYMVSVACESSIGLETTVFERETGTVVGSHELKVSARIARLDVRRKRLICGLTDGSVAVYDLTQPQKIVSKRKPQGSGVTALDIHPLSGAILAGFENGEVIAFQPEGD